MGAVWAEGGGDVVPAAAGDACQQQVLWMLTLDEEVGVSILFDGEEDKIIVAAIANDSGCACGFGCGCGAWDERRFGGCGTAKEEEAERDYYYVFARTVISRPKQSPVIRRLLRREEQVPSSQRHAEK